MAKRKDKKSAAAKPKAKKTAAGKPATKTAAKKGTAAKPAAKKRAAKTRAAGQQKLTVDQMLLELIEGAGNILSSFMDVADLHNNLTPKERERLISAGVRNYGFIEKVRDIARDNPTYLPPNFNVNQFSALLETFDKVRQFYLLAEKLESISSDKMLLMSNDLYRESLRVYNTLREQSRAGVAGARDLFNALQIFFRRRRPSERPPTEAEELRKARSLIKGTSEGEMNLKNFKAKKTGGVHEVVEDIRKDRLSGKETETFSE